MRNRLLRTIVAATMLVALFALAAPAGAGSWSPSAFSMLTTSKGVDFGAKTVVTARLTDQNGVALAGKQVAFEKSRGSGFSVDHYVTSGSDGTVSATVSPLYLTCYRFSFAGDGTAGPVTTDYVEITPKARVSTAHAPLTVRRMATFTTWGLVYPFDTSVGKGKPGWRVARIDFYQRVSGRWIRRLHPWRTLGYTNRSGKWVIKARLRYTGRWRIRVYHYCGEHARSYSGYRYLTVKK